VGFNRWDWISNAGRFASPYDDYYHQLRRNIDGILTRIKGLDCYRRASSKPRIVSTGHSLGGGLAQFAALANKPNGSARISKVFAFDPSPVTGAHLIKAEIRSQNAEGLTIDRIYQDGEILSYARRAIQEYPPAGSLCNPIVRTVKVDAVAGSSAFGLHGMNPLAVQIVDSSYDGNRLKTYQIPPNPDPETCKKIRYNPTDEDIVASAGGRQRLLAFTPNYVGYADQLGASYASTLESGRSIKAAGVSVRRVALLSGEGRRKTGRAAPSHKVVAQIEGPAFFSPLHPAQ
jgi:pimeloyl-ACP methyl ester carboxylesterase